MKVIILAALLSAAAFSASAQTVTCKPQADEKKLAGAALKSFTTKCERDAKQRARLRPRKRNCRALLKRASRRNARVTPLGRKPCARLAMNMLPEQGSIRPAIGSIRDRPGADQSEIPFGGLASFRRYPRRRRRSGRRALSVSSRPIQLSIAVAHRAASTRSDIDIEGHPSHSSNR